MAKPANPPDPPKPTEGGPPNDSIAKEGSKAKEQPKAREVDPNSLAELKRRAAEGEALDVGQLAAVTGNIKRVRVPRVTTKNPETGRTETDGATDSRGFTFIFSAEHKAAATLHGWGHHQHHSGKPLTLKLEDYEKALEAATKSTEGYITPVPYLPAFSKHAPSIKLVTTKLEKVEFPPKKDEG